MAQLEIEARTINAPECADLTQTSGTPAAFQPHSTSAGAENYSGWTEIVSPAAV